MKENQINLLSIELTDNLKSKYVGEYSYEQNCFHVQRVFDRLTSPMNEFWDIVAFGDYEYVLSVTNALKELRGVGKDEVVAACFGLNIKATKEMRCFFENQLIMAENNNIANQN